MKLITYPSHYLENYVFSNKNLYKITTNIAKEITPKNSPIKEYKPQSIVKNKTIISKETKIKENVIKYEDIELLKCEKEEFNEYKKIGSLYDQINLHIEFSDKNYTEVDKYSKKVKDFEIHLKERKDNIMKKFETIRSENKKILENQKISILNDKEEGLETLYHTNIICSIDERTEYYDEKKTKLFKTDDVIIKNLNSNFEEIGTEFTEIKDTNLSIISDKIFYEQHVKMKNIIFQENETKISSLKTECMVNKYTNQLLKNNNESLDYIVSNYTKAYNTTTDILNQMKGFDRLKDIFFKEADDIIINELVEKNLSEEDIDIILIWYENHKQDFLNHVWNKKMHTILNFTKFNMVDCMVFNSVGKETVFSTSINLGDGIFSNIIDI
jgi:hypothetical protein